VFFLFSFAKYIFLSIICIYLLRIELMTKEDTIKKIILNYLIAREIEKKDIYHFRSGAGAVKINDPNNTKQRFFRTGRPGCPDITLCYKGAFIGIEVKTETGIQSQSQKEAEIQIVNAWGKYYLVRSLEEVKEILK